MSEDTKKPEQQADNSLSRKRKLALVAYLAILFIVALAVVTLSLVIQIHNNTEQYQGIAEKAYILQEENVKLKREQSTQASELSSLQSEAEALRADAEAKQAENETLTAENATLKDENDALKKQYDDTVKAYDLLAKAKAAFEANDEEGFRAAMDELAPLSENLSEQAKTAYGELLNSMAAHTPEP